MSNITYVNPFILAEQHTCANSVNPDETVCNEPSHLDHRDVNFHLPM